MCITVITEVIMVVVATVEKVINGIMRTGKIMMDTEVIIIVVATSEMSLDTITTTITRSLKEIINTVVAKFKTQTTAEATARMNVLVKYHRMVFNCPTRSE
jgi:hypothetical protein